MKIETKKMTNAEKVIINYFLQGKVKIIFLNGKEYKKEEIELV